MTGIAHEGRGVIKCIGASKYLEFAASRIIDTSALNDNARLITRSRVAIRHICAIECRSFYLRCVRRADDEAERRTQPRPRQRLRGAKIFSGEPATREIISDFFGTSW